MAGDRRSVDRQAEFGHHLRGRALDRLAADDRRHRRRPGPARAQRVAHAGQAQNRIDADQRVRRADHDHAQIVVAKRGEKIGMRPRRRRRRQRRSRAPPGCSAAARNNPGNRASLPRSAARVRTGSSLIGNNRAEIPSRRRKSSVIADRRSPARRRRVRSTWVARSPSPSWNQVLPTKRFERRHKGPGLAAPTPAGVGIVEAGEGVEQRVEIGRDRQPEMLEIVAGIGDNGQRAGRQDAIEAERQFGAADPTRQRQDKAARPGHRNRSCSAGRINAAAGASGADQPRPRTRTIGIASSAWPINKPAAAAISSAKPVSVTSNSRPKRSA